MQTRGGAGQHVLTRLTVARAATIGITNVAVRRMPLLRTIRVPLQQGGRTPQCNKQLHAVPGPGPSSSPGALDRVRQGRTRQTHPGTRHHSAANTDSYSYTDSYSRPHALTVPHRSCPLPCPSHVPSAFQFGLSHWPTSFENSTEKRICACTRHGSTVSKTDRRHSQRTFATRARVGSLQHRRYNQPTVRKRSVVQKKNNLDLVEECWRAGWREKQLRRARLGPGSVLPPAPLRVSIT